MSISIILLVFAFVLAALATFNIGHPRFNLVAASLAFFFLSVIFGGARIG